MFYFNLELKDVSAQLDLCETYLCTVIRHKKKLSPKVARKMLQATNGYVTAESALGPPTHQELKKLD